MEMKDKIRDFLDAAFSSEEDNERNRETKEALYRDLCDRYDDLIRDYIDCAVFIDTPLDIAMARRILRDMKNASADEIREEMNVYLNYARIAYVQMLKDIKPSSDYVIDGARDLEHITMELLDIIMNRGDKK